MPARQPDYEPASVLLEKIKAEKRNKMTDSSIVSKIWNLAGVLRDDGYSDYLEQITYLLFLKMADELNKPPYGKGWKFPKLKDVEETKSQMVKPVIGKHFQAKEVQN